MNLGPIIQVFIILAGLKPQPKILLPNQKKHLAFLALAYIVYYAILPAPAGDSKINCVTLFLYFS